MNRHGLPIKTLAERDKRDFKQESQMRRKAQGYLFGGEDIWEETAARGTRQSPVSVPAIHSS